MALLSVLDAELSAGSLQLLLNRILEISRNIFGAKMGLIMLEDDAAVLRVRAAAGLPEQTDLEEFATPVGEGLSGSIALSGEPAISLDPSHDERLQSQALRRSAKSLWGMPLRKDSKTLGVILIGFDRPYDWLPTERELLRAIAERSALAIDRAQIAEALREREGRIAELSGHLLRAQEEERKRISRELHDETGQALMVIRLYLGMLEAAVHSRLPRAKIRETVEIVDRTIEGIRRIIGKLSPLVLQELGLVAAIRKESKDLAKNVGVKTRVLVGDDVGRLAPETEMALYRVAQEALHNVAKHAQAHTASVQLSRQGASVRLVIEDDGVGFPPKTSNSRGHSFGLAGIKERVHSMGGSVRLQSARGKGTRLEVVVPAEGIAGLETTQAVAAPSIAGVH